MLTGAIRALTTLKAKYLGAVKGHLLLKKKADALSLRFRAILSKIVEVRCTRWNLISDLAPRTRS